MSCRDYNSAQQLGLVEKKTAELGVEVEQKDALKQAA